MSEEHRSRVRLRAVARDPLTWFTALLVLFVLGMNGLQPIFAAAFPE
ncbi:MAG: hypothetical protein IT518_18375, partial [Burkholderiales bacterium]|nr:hypothetical protein [Burkholderiales bacterium]